MEISTVHVDLQRGERDLHFKSVSEGISTRYLYVKLVSSHCSAISMCDRQAADPLFDLIWQEGTNHGEDRPEEHWLVDQVDSSYFQWKRVLNTHTHKQKLIEHAHYLVQPHTRSANTAVFLLFDWIVTVICSITCCHNVVS